MVVTNYLWRPLLPRIADAVAPGGVLLYETFAQGNETVGKPSRADFLLAPGELLRAFASLRVVAFEDLGMEAIYEFEVQDMPVTVAVDSNGTSVHTTGPAEWSKKIVELKIPVTAA